MNIPEDILDIMLDTLSGAAGEEEHRRLREWLDASGSHRAGWQELCALWYSGSVGAGEAPGKAWEYILARHARGVRRRWILRGSVVASVALLLATFLLPRDVAERSPDLSSWLGKRVPGRVELVLADGSRVALDRPAERWEESVRVANDSAGVRYLASDEAETGERSPALHTLIVPRGGEYRATLSDGTVVELNSGTTLRFPARFGGETREAWLSGEAYFRVNGGGKPFTVHANRVTVTVTGTGFNVAAYPDDRATGVALATGSVEVRVGDRVERLSPGYRVEVDNETLETRVEKVDVAAIAAWKDGVLRFDDIPLEELMRRLERWYDVPFDFRGERLERSLFSGGFRRYEPLERVLHVLGEVNDAVFRVENDTIVISNK
ncbi:MAG: DUF4974 domain-containing protein [Odoribacteraceae bacterium]|jgi:ferric-dicitrate binding protein FerR (iron transport regulator)|nr:DUF4974 domain-containing protein [Odoribacteraceae bacterium]